MCFKTRWASILKSTNLSTYLHKCRIKVTRKAQIFPKMGKTVGSLLYFIQKGKK